MNNLVKEVMKDAAFPGVKKACDDFLADKPECMIVDIKHVGKMVKQ